MSFKKLLRECSRKTAAAYLRAWRKCLATFVVVQTDKGCFDSADGSLRDPPTSLRMTLVCTDECYL